MLSIRNLLLHVLQVLIHDTDSSSILLQLQVHLLQLLFQGLQSSTQAGMSAGVQQHACRDACQVYTAEAAWHVKEAFGTCICASSSLFSAFAKGGRNVGSSSPSDRPAPARAAAVVGLSWLHACRLLWGNLKLHFACMT